MNNSRDIIDKDGQEEKMSSKKPNATKSYDEFMASHRIKKGETGCIITNTRIDTFEDNKTKRKQYMGNFQITGAGEYDKFLEIYYEQIILGQRTEKLTEIQLNTEKSPLLIDVDLRYSFDVSERFFTNDDIGDLLKIYLAVFEEIHQFDPDEIIECFVMTKPNINHVQKGEDKYVKDGFHIIVGIQCDHKCQQYIRKRVIEEIVSNPPPFWRDYPTTNTLDQVFDERISKGDCPWQLYGSGKKELKENSHNEIYTLSQIYKWELDMDTDIIVQTEYPVAGFDMRANFKKLSARYEHHPPFYPTNFYTEQMESIKAANSQRKRESVDNVVIGDSRGGSGDDTDNDDTISDVGGGRTPAPLAAYCIPIDQIKSISVLQLSNVAELDKYIIDYFIDNPFFEQKDEKEKKQIVEYTLILPPKYWGQGSYENWIRVGWALYNIHDAFFAIWVKLSSQWSGFVWPTDVYSLHEKWITFKRGTHALSGRSIIYWAKNDAYAKYSEIKSRYSKEFVDDILSRFDSVSHEDFAILAFMMYPDKYVYSMENWYEFKEPRWHFMNNTTPLNYMISREIREMFRTKTLQIQTELNSPRTRSTPPLTVGTTQAIPDEDDDNETRKKFLKMQIRNLNTIVKKLGDPTEISKIIKQMVVSFTNEDFAEQLDENRDLLCFNNGIIDLKNGLFRNGAPGDYITKSTKINYIPLANVPKEHIVELNKFMDSLFPDADLCRYMWDHLASAISGQIHNQTFNYYIGEGSNGKSVLTDLLCNSLGDYYCASVISLITDEAGKHGSPDSFLAQLKGARIVVMQEPSKGKTLKEGLMKQLTSGIDEIKTRALFKEPISFKPHLTLIVCANQFLKIDSQDEGTWRRIRAIPFFSKFSRTPDPNNRYEFIVDLTMSEKLKEIRESFISLLVARYFETHGVVEECEIVIKKSNEYRNNEDVINRFIDENIYLIPAEEIDATAPPTILKQQDVLHLFKIFKEINGDGRKYNSKEIFTAIGKRYPASVEYIGRTQKVQWKNLGIIGENDD